MYILEECKHVNKPSAFIKCWEFCVSLMKWCLGPCRQPHQGTWDGPVEMRCATVQGQTCDYSSEWAPEM
jgi:hypothetical protein